MKAIGERPKQMVTLVGEVTVKRPYYYHPRCKSRAVPLDEHLGLGASSLSRGVEEAVSLVSAHLSFEEAVYLLARVGLVSVSSQTAQKVAESVGEQIVQAQQAEREAAWAGRMPEPPKRVPKRLYVSMDGIDVHIVAQALYGENSEETKAWAKALLDELWTGQVESLLEEFKRAATFRPSARATVEEHCHYFSTNRERMRYAHFRTHGYQIGRGNIESACKRVIAARLKQAGMIWSSQGAIPMAHLRALILSRRWDAFWKSRKPPKRHYSSVSLNLAL